MEEEERKRGGVKRTRKKLGKRDAGFNHNGERETRGKKGGKSQQKD